ncbi:MAG: hypothetical protein ACJ700_08755 [Nitrososphaera sp.]
MGRTLERAIGVNMIVIQFLSDGIPMSETRIQCEMPTALDRVSGGRLQGQDELCCEYCSDKTDISGHRKLLLALLATRNSSRRMIGRRRRKTGKTKEKSKGQQIIQVCIRRMTALAETLDLNPPLLVCKTFLPSLSYHK